MQLLPEQPPQPAVTEAARPQQLHLREHDRDGVEGVGGNRPVIGEETQLARLAAAFIEDRDRLSPRGLLAVVDLAEVEHLALGGVAAIEPA